MSILHEVRSASCCELSVEQQNSSRRPQQQQLPPQQLPAAAAAAAAAALALKFHPKHATNKNKTKYIMKIAHISFV
jgi:hypothetical protein